MPLPIAVLGGVIGFALGWALLRQTGGAAVGLAAVAGASLALLGWYLAYTRHLIAHRDASRTLLGLAESRRRDTTEQLQLRADRLQREAEGLARRISAMEEMRIHYESGLSAIATRSSRTVHHLTATLIYEIGETADDDRMIERYRTVADDAARPLLWCEIRVGLVGAETPTLRSFGDLRDVEASQIIEGYAYRIEPLPAGQVGPSYRALVLFEPVIGAEPRDWEWSYRWPLWNPLRQRDRDTLRLELYRTIRYDVLELQVVFPGSAISPVMRPRESTNRFQPEPTVRDESGRHVIVVRMTEPAPDHYSWALTVGGFTNRSDPL